MRVEVEIDEAELENDDGRDVPGVIAHCERCDHETESFGTQRPLGAALPRATARGVPSQ